MKIWKESVGSSEMGFAMFETENDSIDPAGITLLYDGLLIVSRRDWLFTEHPITGDSPVMPWHWFLAEPIIIDPGGVILMNSPLNIGKDIFRVNWKVTFNAPFTREERIMATLLKGIACDTDE